VLQPAAQAPAPLSRPVAVPASCLLEQVSLQEFRRPEAQKRFRSTQSLPPAASVKHVAAAQ
jgi:hypothetical protein